MGGHYFLHCDFTSTYVCSSHPENEVALQHQGRGLVGHFKLPDLLYHTSEYLSIQTLHDVISTSKYCTFLYNFKMKLCSELQDSYMCRVRSARGVRGGYIDENFIVPPGKV